MEKTYILPKDLQSKLRRPWGKKFFGSKKEVLEKFEKFLKTKNVKKIITVGDFCSKNLPSNIKIFDGKIKRRKIKKVLPYSLKCKNPKGTIQKEVWEIIKRAIRKEKMFLLRGKRIFW